MAGLLDGWVAGLLAAPLGFLSSWADYLHLQTGKRQAKTMVAICLLNLRSFFCFVIPASSFASIWSFSKRTWVVLHLLLFKVYVHTTKKINVEKYFPLLKVLVCFLNFFLSLLLFLRTENLYCYNHRSFWNHLVNYTNGNPFRKIKFLGFCQLKYSV